MQLFQGSGDPAMDVLVWPSVDISGVNSSPPLVDCGQHPQLGGRIYLAAHHVIDAVHVLAPALTDAQRDAIAENIGAATPAQRGELMQRIAELEVEVDQLRANATVPLAEVLEHLRQQPPTPADDVSTPAAANAETSDSPEPVSAPAEQKPASKSRTRQTKVAA